MWSHFNTAFLNSTQVYLLEPVINVFDINLVVQFYHPFILKLPFFLPASRPVVVAALSLSCGLVSSSEL